MGTRALTRDLIKRLATALTKTPLTEVAVGSIGLPKSTYYHWKALAQDIADGNPDRENLAPNDELLLEFLDAIEQSRAKVGQKLSDAALKGAMQDPRVAIDILQRMFPDQFAAPARREIVIRQEGGEAGTGIALIPTTMIDQDIAQVLAQQQQDALQLAKTRTKELSSDHSTDSD
ncbi:hypothetical protein SHV42_09230 [Pseudomonas capeferrum]|uniref:hypothetical protein n=1 Tax=Pseudomonas capeferrum TaxID=1495066 RepID=UPI003978DE92